MDYYYQTLNQNVHLAIVTFWGSLPVLVTRVCVRVSAFTVFRPLTTILVVASGFAAYRWGRALLGAIATPLLAAQTERWAAPRLHGPVERAEGDLQTDLSDMGEERMVATFARLWDEQPRTFVRHWAYWCKSNFDCTPVSDGAAQRLVVRYALQREMARQHVRSVDIAGATAQVLQLAFTPTAEELLGAAMEWRFDVRLRRAVYRAFVGPRA